MSKLIEEMWAIPAQTDAGRKSKVLVLLTCVLGGEWRDRDDQVDYRTLTARQLLIDLVGGEAAASLREQFTA
jgi:hypothetical protein